MRKRTGYLIRRGEVYYAVWTVGDKKFMKTTGKLDKREARKELNRIMEPFIAGDEVTTLQNIAAKIEGRKAELVTLEDKLHPPLTIGEAWTAFLHSPNRPDSGPATLEAYSVQWGIFWKWMTTAHPDVKSMRNVTPDIAGEFVAHLTSTGRSPNTFNKYVNLLSLVFRTVRDKAKLLDNPWEHVTRKRSISNSRRELTVDELRRICSTATGEMRLLLAIGIYTGLRRGDCATLRWCEVDLQRGIIRRIPNKTGRRNPKPVHVPIHAALAEMLNEIPAAERGDYVLPVTAKNYLRDNTVLTDAVRALIESAGIVTHAPGTGQGTKKRAVVEVGFHSLRHTFVSMCAAGNVPLSVVQSIVGHSNPSMTMHYQHTGEAAARAAVSGLPSLHGEAPVLVLPPADPLATIKANVRALADKLNGKNWQTVKKEFLELAE